MKIEKKQNRGEFNFARLQVVILSNKN